MKKTTKVSGSNDGFKSVLPKKKRRGGALEDSSDDKNSRLWGSKTGDTTESNSINMEKECLMEETSFRQESGEESGGVDTNMMSKGPKRIVTKHTLGKPLGTINFGMENDDDDDILDGSFSLPSFLSLKHMVQVSVRKSFALDIDLRVVAGKSSQEKLAYVRKIFSGVNGFGRISIPSKFSGIIRAFFTSEKAMIVAAKIANDRGIMVNTNLKCPGDNCMNRTIVLKKILVETSVEAVHVVVSEFGKIKMIKMQLVGLWQKVIVELEDQTQADLLASKWSILIGKDAVHVARTDIDKQL
ncbi:hypothetical protein G9A89_004925 [Geosiphon pyriformis]|nr:hypothetical protein G9A89_004925 [Geosiphon pyriformis]